MKKTLILVVSLVIVLLAVWLVRSPQQTADGPTATVESSSESVAADKVLDLSFADYEGRAVALKDWLGTPLVVNAWAAWCPFCREELRDFAAVQKEFGDKVVIVAIDRAEPLATAKKYTDELGVSGNLALLLDPADSFYKAIGAFSMPETIFIDGSGRIVFHKRGPMAADEIRQRIVSLIKSG